MLVKIIRIKTGAQYEGKVYDYFTDAETLNKFKMEIFDPECFSKDLKEGDIIDAILYAISYEESNLREGAIKAKYYSQIPDEYKEKYKKYLHYRCVEFENDLVLLSGCDIKKTDGEDFYISFKSHIYLHEIVQ